jgi:mRNA-degrading endonuclease RelE of RelBE toxin-antitoxin system
MKTVIETTEFQRAAAKIWSEDERAELISYIAHNPFAGDVIPGAKAVRKFRWQVAGRGKRGGARVIYYNWIDQDCVVLLTVYTKSTQSNMAVSDIARRRNDERKNTDSS